MNFDNMHDIRSVFLRLYKGATNIFGFRVMENRSSGAYIFFQRQFWSCVKVCVKILVVQECYGKMKSNWELILDNLSNRDFSRLLCARF